MPSFASSARIFLARQYIENPVRPVKAGAFSGSESRQGKSQEPCSLSRR